MKLERIVGVVLVILGVVVGGVLGYEFAPGLVFGLLLLVLGVVILVRT